MWFWFVSICRRLRLGWILAGGLLMVALVSAPVVAAVNAAPASPDEILHYLGSTIDWFRSLEALDQTPTNSEELLFQDTARRSSRWILQWGFEFARAEAAVFNAAPKPATNPSTRPTTAGKSRNWAQSAAMAAERVKLLQASIDQINNDIEQASATSRPDLTGRRDKLVAQLNLANARRDALAKLAGVASRVSGGEGGFLDKITDLERSVPDSQVDQSAALTAKADANASGAQPAQALRPEAAGIVGLVSDMFSLLRRMKNLKEVADQAEDLRQANEQLLIPLRAALVDAVKRGDELATTRESDDADKLAADRLELDALTARFKQLASAGVPLGEQGTYLESSRANLLEWRAALDRLYGNDLRSLIFRLSAAGITIFVLLLVSRIWRQVTMRFVQDVRRRRQFLMVRRIVVTVIIIIVLVASFVTEFGSLATYAGLLTAGIAVALQTVILSGVAYFFLIGRYGVRSGDRVTVSGITGDVIDVGLFRLYLMELSGSELELQPTGRIVVFSNSVLFQPVAFFKQIQGADYVWHKVALTLSMDSDFKAAGQRLLAAVESVFADYRSSIEAKHASFRDSISLQVEPPRPYSRLRFVDNGLEFVIRYPVELRRAAEIDERMTVRLLETIEQTPKLNLAGSGMPKIQPG